MKTFLALFVVLGWSVRSIFSISGDHTADGNTNQEETPPQKLGPPESLHLGPRIINLNIMVAGLSGLGKTTMCAALLDSWQEVQEESKTTTTTSSSSPAPSTRKISTFFHSKQPQKTRKQKKPKAIPTITDHIITSSPFEYHDKEANTILRVRIIDTPGFGNRVNHRHSVQPITDFIGDCRNQKYKHETSSSKYSQDDEDDSLVHVCLYFLSPGRFLAIDRHFLRNVQKEVTLVPIIAKADTMTDDEIAQYRAQLVEIFKREKIDVYNFEKDWLPSKNASTNKLNRGRRPGEALAIISRDGTYAWGTSSSFDPNHSDLSTIRDLLLSEHTERFLQLAKEKYTDYRAGRIRRRKFTDAVKYAALVGLAIVQVARQPVMDTRIEPIITKLNDILAILREKKKKISIVIASKGSQEVALAAGQENEGQAADATSAITTPGNRRYVGLFGTPPYGSIQNYSS